MYTPTPIFRSPTKEQEAALAKVIENNLRRNFAVTRTRKTIDNEPISNYQELENKRPFKKQRKGPADGVNVQLLPWERLGSIKTKRVLSIDGETGGVMEQYFLSNAHRRLSRVSEDIHQRNRESMVSALTNRIHGNWLPPISGLPLEPYLGNTTMRSASNALFPSRLPLLSSYMKEIQETPMKLSNVCDAKNMDGGQDFQLHRREYEIARPEQDPPSTTDCSFTTKQGTRMSLAADEDNNWLSELQCFVRSDLIEVFKASRQDVEDRKASKNVNYLQVGIRCRFCAHLPSNQRTQRSSSFPSSIPQIYQSFTMMVREHFGKCPSVPAPMKEKFFALKQNSTQGDVKCKEYWVYSAAKIGLLDTEDGIVLNEKTRAKGLLMAPFGAGPSLSFVSQTDPMVLLVTLDDRGLVSEFVYNLMLQCQKIHLKPSEMTGSRKMLQIGMPGFGCRHCCAAGKFGLSRVYPVKRSKLPGQVRSFFDHVRRCTSCPLKTKVFLAQLSQEEQVAAPKKSAHNEREFFDRVWAKLENA